MEKKIKIDLDAWEAAPSPIYTKEVDIDRAEQLLTLDMLSYYSQQEIDDFLTGKADSYATDKFNELLCEREEKVVIYCGGIYYEDMEDDDERLK